MSADPTAAASRCAEHPGRPARDRCTQCQRARCDADAARFGANGCAVCRRHTVKPRPPGSGEVVLRGAMAGLLVALIGGGIATQYVEDHIFSLVVPGLVGLAAAWASSAAIGRGHRSGQRISLLISGVAALLGTALGFRLVPGGRQSVLHPLGVVGAPYLCALLGAVLWMLVTGVPRSSREGER